MWTYLKLRFTALKVFLTKTVKKHFQICKLSLLHFTFDVSDVDIYESRLLQAGMHFVNLHKENDEDFEPKATVTRPGEMLTSQDINMLRFGFQCRNACIVGVFCLCRKQFVVTRKILRLFKPLTPNGNYRLRTTCFTSQ
jgi:hypothetical protein